VAFFLVEMGDKTQLATISLAAKYQSILPVLTGTTAGMLIADAIGIGIGIVLGKTIPERAIKWIAALIFIGFGMYGLYENLPLEYLKFPIVLPALGAIILAMVLLGRDDIRRLCLEQPNGNKE
jgi:uncharacterized membrane protein